MHALYNAGLRAYGLALRMAAPFHPKAAAWVTGRKEFPRPKEQYASGYPKIWFHCASLGEFEQGRPVMEALKAEHPHASILVTFFSPSGYLIRKYYPLASQVEYLPLDSVRNARRFVQSFKPELAVFVKYEFWYNYLDALRAESIPYLFISAVFRPSQPFFRPWGAWFRRRLAGAATIFVQEEASLRLLQGIGLQQASVSGDTRYDRVTKIAAEARPLADIEKFIRNRPCLVAGSTWQEDEKLLARIMEAAPESLCLIIAPHEITEARIRAVSSAFGNQVVRYSERNSATGNARVLVIDNIGMLSSIYRYATFTWVGGGFGSGLHNILEPAAHGKPVIFGSLHKKFPEAAQLIAAGGGYSIHDASESIQLVNRLLEDPQVLQTVGEKSKAFIQSHTGACAMVSAQCSRLIAQSQ